MNKMTLREKMLAAYPTIEALRGLSAKLDTMVQGRSISSAVAFTSPTVAAFGIIEECVKHGWTVDRIDAAL